MIYLSDMETTKAASRNASARIAARPLPVTTKGCDFVLAACDIAAMPDDVWGAVASVATGIDCTMHPVTLWDMLAHARAMRTQWRRAGWAK